jgi:hypothetical protein
MKGPIIDQKLLGNRNPIAHGHPIPIDIAEYSSLQTDVISIAELFKTDVENSALNSSFKRT